jgi:hypothetical protein
MRPALKPGDAVVTIQGGRPRTGQVRVLRYPWIPSRWLIKRVGGVRSSGGTFEFEALSDHPGAPGTVDSRDFGWVPAADSYRVLWTIRAKR